MNERERREQEPAVFPARDALYESVLRGLTGHEHDGAVAVLDKMLDADSPRQASQLIVAFAREFEQTYPEAATKLLDARDELVALYDRERGGPRPQVGEQTEESGMSNAEGVVLRSVRHARSAQRF